MEMFYPQRFLSPELEPTGCCSKRKGCQNDCPGPISGDVEGKLQRLQWRLGQSTWRHFRFSEVSLKVFWAIEPWSAGSVYCLLTGWHQPIASSKVDLSSRSNGIHLRALLWKDLKMLISNTRLKIAPMSPRDQRVKSSGHTSSAHDQNI